MARTDAHRRLDLKWMKLRGRRAALTAERDRLRSEIIDAMSQPDQRDGVPTMAARIKSIEAEIAGFAREEHQARLAVMANNRRLSA